MPLVPNNLLGLGNGVLPRVSKAFPKRVHMQGSPVVFIVPLT